MALDKMPKVAERPSVVKDLILIRLTYFLLALKSPCLPFDCDPAVFGPRQSKRS